MRQPLLCRPSLVGVYGQGRKHLCGWGTPATSGIVSAKVAALGEGILNAMLLTQTKDGCWAVLNPAEHGCFWRRTAHLRGVSGQESKPSRGEEA